MNLTSCPECRAAGVDHKSVVDKCKSSPYWTGRLLCGFDRLSPSFHANLAEWFVKKLAEGKRRFLVMTPRDHYKTTLFGISTAIWFLHNDINSRILYMMASGEQSQSKFGAIKDILAHRQELRHFFPNVVPDLKDPRCIWQQNKIILPQRDIMVPDGSVEGRGLRSNVTGGHFTVQIFDDLIDETMVNSAVEQERAIDFVKRSGPLFFDLSKDIQIIIGTRWPGPFYDWILEDSGLIERYETLVIGCYVDNRYRSFMSSLGKKVMLEDGEPIFPEHFDKESLEGERAFSEYDFSHQWLNIKADESERRFNEEDFQYYKYNGALDGIVFQVDRKVKFDDLYRTMTIDPATGEHSKTDKSAITVCGFDKTTGNIFVLDAWHGRVLPDVLIDKTLEMAKKWKVHVVGPEDVSYQKTFKFFLKQEMMKRNVHFQIKPVKPGGKGKGARIIDGLQPFVSNRQLFVRNEHKALVRELVDLQVVGGKVVGRSPNLADSLAYHPEFWRFTPTKKKNSKRGIDYMSPFIDKKPDASYGLECTT